MKSFQPKTEAAAPDDEAPGHSPGHGTPAKDQPEQTQTETDPMPRPDRQNRNA